MWCIFVIILLGWVVVLPHIGCKHGKVDLKSTDIQFYFISCYESNKVTLKCLEGEYNSLFYKSIKSFQKIETNKL
jgi:hypothetical protein